MFNTDMPTRAELPSAQRLLRSTAIAAGVAVVLLFAIVLPSEYGIDPIGVGKMLGLTKMGDIKTQLAREAQQGKEAPKQAAPAVTPVASQDFTQIRTDEVKVVLKPGQGAEIKLTMRKDAKVSYAWSSEGGPVNHDTHGDGKGQEHRYKKELQVTGDSGELTAVFDGVHGWFWRNRTAQEVTVSLKCTGDYQTIKRMS